MKRRTFLSAAGLMVPASILFPRNSASEVFLAIASREDDPYSTYETFHIDKNHLNANDSNPGTESLPWLTLQKAGDTLIGGQRALVKNGVYGPELPVHPMGTYSGVYFANSGSDGNYVVIQNYPGHTPVLNQNAYQDANNWRSGFVFAGADHHCVVRGFEITDANQGILGAGSTGVYAIRIEKCKIHHHGRTENGGCIKLFNRTYGVYVGDCEIYDYDYTGDPGYGAGIHAFASSGFDGYETIFEHNYFHDISTNDGYAFQGKSSAHSNYNGQQTGPIIRSNRFELNPSLNAAIGMFQAGGGGPAWRYTKIYENIIKDVNIGVNVGIQDGANIGIEIYNNVFHGGTTPAIWFRKGDNTVVHSNIVTTKVCRLPPYSGDVAGVSISEYDHNNQFGLSSSYYVALVGNTYNNLAALNASGYGANNINADPLYVDTIDFKLDTGSPSKGTGKGGVDMGCYPSGDGIVGIR